MSIIRYVIGLVLNFKIEVGNRIVENGLNYVYKFLEKVVGLLLLLLHNIASQALYLL